MKKKSQSCQGCAGTAEIGKKTQEEIAVSQTGSLRVIMRLPNKKKIIMIAIAEKIPFSTTLSERDKGKGPGFGRLVDSELINV